jgi:hypothetical protein
MLYDEMVTKCEVLIYMFITVSVLVYEGLVSPVSQCKLITILGS